MVNSPLYTYVQVNTKTYLLRLFYVALGFVSVFDNIEIFEKTDNKLTLERSVPYLFFHLAIPYCALFNILTIERNFSDTEDSCRRTKYIVCNFTNAIENIKSRILISFMMCDTEMFHKTTVKKGR